MAKSTDKYDAKDKTMWLYRDYGSADTLVPDAEMDGWSAAVRKGETPDGDPLKAANYVFTDRGAAEYNHQPLAFSKLGCYVGKESAKRPYSSGDDPSFESKEDFGL